MTKRRATEHAIDPCDLASGYIFPELFADAPRFRLISEIADDSPFQPSAVVQQRMLGLPPPDHDHIRRKDAERRRARRRR